MTQRSRSRYGQGSITKQPNGRIKATFPAGIDRDGKRLRPSRVFDTKRQADLWLTEMKQQRNLGVRQSRERQTLTQFVEWWLTNDAPLDKRETTVNHYRYAFRKYIEPRLGKKFLDTIAADDVVDLLGSLQRRGLSVQTLRRVRTYLGLFCEQALRYRLMGHNPVKQVKAPRATSLDQTQVQPPMSFQETKDLLRSIAGTDLEGIVFLAVFLGLRRGEVLGLKWSDIDFDGSTVSIRRTLVEGSKLLPDGTGLSKTKVNPPKTRNSKRTLPLPVEVAAVLKRRKSQQNSERLTAGEAWQGEDFVFTNGLGGPLWPSNVITKFRKHLKTNGLRHVRFHDLRHSAACLMLESGSRLEEVSQALGHSSITITKDVYASHVPTLANRAVLMYAEALEGSDYLERVVGGENLTRVDRAPHWRNDS
jgi:integrase